MVTTREKIEIVSLVDTISKNSNGKTRLDNEQGGDSGEGSAWDGDSKGSEQEVQEELQLEPISEVHKAIYATLVNKCGSRHYWEDWSSDIADIAQTHIGRIKNIVTNTDNTKEVKTFNDFAAELRDDLNESIRDEEIIEMLAQHLVTGPVFEALFEDADFAVTTTLFQRQCKGYLMSCMSTIWRKRPLRCNSSTRVFGDGYRMCRHWKVSNK